MVNLSRVLDLAQELVDKREDWNRGDISYAEMFTTMRQLLSALAPYVKAELEAVGELRMFLGDVEQERGE